MPLYTKLNTLYLTLSEVNFGINSAAITPIGRFFNTTPSLTTSETMSQTQPQPQPHSKTKPLSPPKKKLIVLCDGTWCGMETNTQTNIYRLAEMIMGGHNPFNTSPTNPYIDPVRQIIACYFPGGGIGGTFLEYLFNGATGSDIDQDCEEVYRYIVQHYTRDHEIWMFGLSRGAYTVRCVAGMINNCGILTLPNIGLCNHVYQTYRSRGQTDHPADPNMAKFRTLNSHPVPTPVKFMGLLDTVGSLGIPYLAPGIGLDFHEFYNTEISAVVEKVMLCSGLLQSCALFDEINIYIFLNVLSCGCGTLLGIPRHVYP
jgi:uncharacterized protein (DUF2235 family)